MIGALKLGAIAGVGFAVGKYGGAAISTLVQGQPTPGALQFGLQVAVGVVAAGIFAAVIGA